LTDLQQLAQQYDVTIEPQQIGVPRYAPKNKRQFEEWNPVWPVTYREDPRQDPKWTKDDLDTVEDHMRQLMTTGSTDDDGLNVYARIVDPKTNTVLAQASDTRHKGHPLHHAVMNCIDIIANKERQNKAQQTTNIDESKRKHLDDDDDDDTQAAYLCSGYDAYVTHEPCAM
jgi:tRNA-specific adenosine deaminase 3